MEQEKELESNVVTIKLINDTDLVGQMVAISEDNTTITLDFPLEIVSGFDETNHPFAALKLYNAFGSEHSLNFNLSNILFVTPTKEEIEEMYILTVRGIQNKIAYDNKMAKLTPEEVQTIQAMNEKIVTSPVIN